MSAACGAVAPLSRFIACLVSFIWLTNCATDGTPNDWHLVHYGSRAIGGAGLIFTEMTCVGRDARITPIYEGTTGIQAADLIGRKVARDGGEAIRLVIARMREVEAQLGQQDDGALAPIAARLREGIGALERAVQYLVQAYAADVRRASVGAVPFMELFGTVAGGWQMGRAALAARRRLAEGKGEAGFNRAKLATARFYADHVLTRAPGLATAVVEGAEGALAIEDEQL